MEARSSLVKDPLNFYKSVHPQKIIRDASKSSGNIFSHFVTDFWMRKDFYQMIDKFHKQSLADGSYEKLDSES